MSMPMTTPKTPHAPTTPHESMVDEGLHVDASASTDERARSLAERLERARAHNKKRSPPHTPTTPHSPTTPHKDGCWKPAASQKTKQPWDVDVVLEGLLAPSYVVIDTPPPPSAASTGVDARGQHGAQLAGGAQHGASDGARYGAPSAGRSLAWADELDSLRKVESAARQPVTPQGQVGVAASPTFVRVRKGGASASEVIDIWPLPTR